MSFPRRNRGTESGQALVEFAFVLPILILLMMILFDLGRVIFVQNSINQAAREGARAGEVPARVVPGKIPYVEYSTIQYQAIRTRALSEAGGTGITANDVKGAPGVRCTTAGAGSNPAPVNDNIDSSTCFYPRGVGLSSPVVVTVTTTVGLISWPISVIVGGSDRKVTLSATASGYVQ